MARSGDFAADSVLPRRVPGLSGGIEHVDELIADLTQTPDAV